MAMSWVADTKAVREKTRRVHRNRPTSAPIPFGSESASAKKSRTMAPCMDNTHQRLVFTRSTKGPQKGLISQGRYSRLVHAAMDALPMPRRLSRITEMLFTTKYGTPSVK